MTRAHGYLAGWLSLGMVATLAAQTQPAPDLANVQAYQTGGEMPLLERLGCWDAARSSFGTLSADAWSEKLLTSTQFVVMCHGWAPGFRASVDQNPSLRGWDPALKDTAGNSVSPWFAPMATYLAKTTPGAVVAAYSWIDESATTAAGFTSILEAHLSLSRTDANGARLADAINQILPTGWRASGGKVHIIGHSHGARVATRAALAVQPEHLTLFDAPENITALVQAADELDLILAANPQFRLGAAVGATFVDNYYSCFGKAYGRGVVDIQLRPKSSFSLATIADDLVANHNYPTGWYARAMEYNFPVGWAWSPLTRVVDPSSLDPAYVQQGTWAGAGAETFSEFVLTPVGGPGEGTPAASSKLKSTVLFSAGNVTAADDGVFLEAGPGQPLQVLQFTVAAGDTALGFSYDWVDIGNGDELAVYIDDHPRFFMRGSVIKPRNNPAVGVQQTFLDISDLSPGTHQLALVLHSGKDHPKSTAPKQAVTTAAPLGRGGTGGGYTPAVPDYPQPNGGIAKVFVGGFAVLTVPKPSTLQQWQAAIPTGPAIGPTGAPAWPCGAFGGTGLLLLLGLVALRTGRRTRRD